MTAATAFGLPDWSAPLLLEDRLKNVPATSHAKGVFFRAAVNEALRLGGKAPGRGDYNLLADYPTTELIQVLAESASIAYPNLSVREGLRRIGREMFPRARDTAAGTFLFAFAAKNIRTAFRLTGRAYKLFATGPTVTVVEDTGDRFVIELRVVWTFPEAFHVGIFEGGLIAFAQAGEVRVRVLSLCDVDIEVIIHNSGAAAGESR